MIKIQLNAPHETQQEEELAVVIHRFLVGRGFQSKCEIEKPSPGKDAPFRDAQDLKQYCPITVDVSR